MTKIQAPKGTQDVLPAASYRWQSVEAIMRDVGSLYGYSEIRTPVFEHTELFQRGVGDTTDVVQKEMYTFTDKGDRSVTLKPEGTAGVVRAFLEDKLFAGPLPVKMYYVSCPCFRYEKPQAGRLREFHQHGVEVFGAPDATCDAEIIRLALEVLKRAGVKDLSLRINSIGCPACRASYHDALRDFLRPRLDGLCDSCKSRFERNPMRILDCKEASCQQRIEGAPSMLDHLCGECRSHFEKLQSYLTALGIGFTLDPRIVRGLDYYTKTVFEIVTKTPAGELTVCGGGRYDGLVEELGGPKTAGIGFGLGVERLLMVQDLQNAAPAAPARLDAFVCTLGDEARLAGLALTDTLRGAGIKADLDHAARSMKAQFKYADKSGAPIVLILAGDELAQGVVRVRDMAKSEETLVPMDQIIDYFRQ
ncbi:MAG: histidine--tRNA ligase [Clostridia bacterium]|nr:histidine--tRNA ligase [Clostridia bacterium]